MKNCFSSLEDTELFVKNLTDTLSGTYTKTDSLVVGLSGDLGSGKTTLVKMLANCFGCNDIVISPTFCFMRQYSIPKSPFKNLIHIDAYRCEKKKDAQITGIKSAIESKKNLVCIEWVENLFDAFPVDVTILCSLENEKHCFVAEFKNNI